MIEVRIRTVCAYHKINKNHVIDFILLFLHDSIVDGEFELRLRTAKNYKACLREIMQIEHGTALKYLEGKYD